MVLSGDSRKIQAGHRSWNDCYYDKTEVRGIFKCLHSNRYRGAIGLDISRICLVCFSTMAQQDLFGVWREGKFYKRYPPTSTSDDWIGSATLIGTGGWKDFQHLFFHPDGTLYGVFHGRFYKGPPPAYASDNWLDRATLIGKGDGMSFSFCSLTPTGCFSVHN